MRLRGTTKLPEGCQEIPTKEIFKRKLKEFCIVARYKGCQVVQGVSQVEGDDLFDTNTHVARMSIPHTAISLTAEHDLLELNCMDVYTAYLNVPVVQEVFVMLPTEFSPPPNDAYFVLRLRRILYGLK